MIAVASLAAAVGPAAGAGDPERGELLFNQQCSYCHALSPRMAVPQAQAAPPRAPEMSEPGSEPAPAEPAFSGSYKRGPHLDGLLSRAPGAVAGFPYRFIFKIEGPTWTEADLDYYIYNHARLDDASRADLVAYLKKSTSR